MICPYAYARYHQQHQERSPRQSRSATTAGPDVAPAIRMLSPHSSREQEKQVAEVAVLGLGPVTSSQQRQQHHVQSIKMPPSCVTEPVTMYSNSTQEGSGTNTGPTMMDHVGSTTGIEYDPLIGQSLFRDNTMLTLSPSYDLDDALLGSIAISTSTTVQDSDRPAEQEHDDGVIIEGTDSSRARSGASRTTALMFSPAGVADMNSTGSNEALPEDLLLPDLNDDGESTASRHSNPPWSHMPRRPYSMTSLQPRSSSISTNRNTTMAEETFSLRASTIGDSVVTESAVTDAVHLPTAASTLSGLLFDEERLIVNAVMDLEQQGEEDNHDNDVLFPKDVHASVMTNSNKKLKTHHEAGHFTYHGSTTSSFHAS